jgi:dCTP deaminase
MTEAGGLPGLLPLGDNDKSSNVVQLRGTGILPYQSLRAMIAAEEISSIQPILPDQLQPASLDLRLGMRAYGIPASFLPGAGANVMDRVRELDGFPAIDLTGGAVLEKGRVYVVELLESVRLTNGVEGTANPKSSTGRLDVLTRLITDRGTAFDRIDKGYKGRLFLEVVPLSFSIVVRTGSRLNQLRLHRGVPWLLPSEVLRYYNDGQLANVDGERRPLRDTLVPVTVDLRGHPVAGYKARKDTKKVDVDRVGHYDPREFWERIENAGGRLNLDKGDFYILASREEIGVPPELAAEMVPFDNGAGEFRVHYAGFFDPGFGWHDGRAQGSKAVLEVRSYGVSFLLEHGQTVGWLRYSKLAHGRPEVVYGADIKSNYQGQGVALAKHFKAWPR